uniref:Putative ovule protein n=1 Tax=Solanum chacoense TaxID=4108 RepID=A0A0V0HRT8_SOLCH
MKWLWKYSNENQTLWRRVICTKYEDEDYWMTKVVTTPYGTSLWRSIRVLWEEVKPNFKMKVGNGNKIKFWKDEWHEKGNLETLFPDSYNLAMFQQRTIAELLTPQGWNFILKRQPNDWEVMTLIELLNMVINFM